MTGRLRAGRREELPRDRAVEVDLGDHGRAALFDVGGELFAIGAGCHHQGGPLRDGRIVAGPAVVCPWHGWTYDLRSGERVDRPGAPVAVHRVAVVDGWIDLAVPPCA